MRLSYDEVADVITLVWDTPSGSTRRSRHLMIHFGYDEVEQALRRAEILVRAAHVRRLF